MNRTVLASIACILCLTATAPAAESDSQMDRYFSIWADDARVTPAAVDRLYADRVVYYGKSMTSAEVYRDKRNYIRQWPNRHYSVVPGSVSKTCDRAQLACKIYAILEWQKADPSTRRGSKGANTISLTLVRQDGALKIARESGSPIARSACQGTRDRWQCSGYR